MAEDRLFPSSIVYSKSISALVNICQVNLGNFLGGFYALVGLI